MRRPHQPACAVVACARQMVAAKFRRCLMRTRSAEGPPHRRQFNIAPQNADWRSADVNSWSAGLYRRTPTVPSDRSPGEIGADGYSHSWLRAGLGYVRPSCPRRVQWLAIGDGSSSMPSKRYVAIQIDGGILDHLSRCANRTESSKTEPGAPVSPRAGAGPHCNETEPTSTSTDPRQVAVAVALFLPGSGRRCAIMVVASSVSRRPVPAQALSTGCWRRPREFERASPGQARTTPHQSPLHRSGRQRTIQLPFQLGQSADLARNAGASPDQCWRKR